METDVDAFLDKVKNTPLANPTDASNADGKGRLIFAMDATASRQPTWDRAIGLQSDMFANTRGIGSLDVQLVYYRGYRECRSSPWLSNADQVIGMMQKVRCEAGQTQIARVLKHALAETRAEAVQALVFVGDCVEEPIDTLGDLAGQLRLHGLPVFVFQEGHNHQAARAFSAIARLSGGAHCQLDANAAHRLGELLNAVAVYAAGGRLALKQLSKSSDAAVKLLEQLD